ncbi:MAG TPA: heparan-alpha-glucosaminide N-acetyltransferase domain-containing protein [Methanofastidiosum sp.]|nr:heparan-alpha-glucosaminide N-acetyltransferase domain-containing protein [Synergistaceae bacterium]HOI77528.1 heparan-alpha-glucosaminide N-acetyltransferase domain-containing protein [Methanofastidiosum sp.]
MADDNRLESIDEFRGFAIFMMVIINFLARANNVPLFLKHAPDIGFTVADIVAPMFIFAIGLTYGLSFRKRVERAGKGKTYSHFFTRYMAIAGIGFFLTAFGNLTGTYENSSNWGLLQAIGAAGLFTLIFIKFSTKIRAIVGVLFLIFYQFMLERFWLQTILSSSHGGIYGSLSWGAMLLLGTVFADLYHSQNNNKRFLFVAIIVLVIGLFLLFFIPISKNRVSFSYVLVALSLSALIFEIFDYSIKKFRINIRLLSSWGKNPLLLYILHIFLLGIFVIPPYRWWHTEASILLLFVEIIGLIGILSWIGIFLDSKKWYFSL